MRYQHFANADLEISQMACGTWALVGNGNGEIGDNNSVKAIRRLLDGGVNLIDTAPVYGAGHSEEVVGKAINGLDREKIYIATKCCSGVSTMKYHRYGGSLPIRDGSYANVLYEVEQSLRRLKTDYIDFLIMHWPDYDVDIAETMEAFNELKKEGKIRFIGVSNFNKEQIMAAQKYAKIDVIQPPYSMVMRRDTELMKWAKEQGIDTLTYASLGAGILTGAFRELPKFKDDDPRNTFYIFFKEPYFSKV